MTSNADVALHHLQRREERDTVSPSQPPEGEVQNAEDADITDATNEWRPTRKYQAALLAAGFLMIFHVIGINSIYGVFQVSTNRVSTI